MNRPLRRGALAAKRRPLNQPCPLVPDGGAAVAEGGMATPTVVPDLDTLKDGLPHLYWPSGPSALAAQQLGQFPLGVMLVDSAHPCPFDYVGSMGGAGM